MAHLATIDISLSAGLMTARCVVSSITVKLRRGTQTLSPSLSVSSVFALSRFGASFYVSFVVRLESSLKRFYESSVSEFLRALKLIYCSFPC